MPQTKPMSVGSAFDAFVKNYLYEGLVGKNPAYELATLIEKQVESQNRDWALVAGRNCFDQYKESGALSDLIREMEGAIGKPSFEFEIRGPIEWDGETIPCLLGKPDLFFTNKEGIRVMYDFKVNGYCSKSGVSPIKGYVKLRPGNTQHRDCHPIMFCGIMVNAAEYLEAVDQSWADQLATYLWLVGEPVGTQKAVAGIEQLACKPEGNSVAVRIASHRNRVSRAWQETLFKRYKAMDDTIRSGWIFREMSEAESRARQELLDQRAANVAPGNDSLDDWFNQSSREI
jgi:hypothetical protein